MSKQGLQKKFEQNCKLTIIGLDPGQKNFSLTVQTVSKKKLSIKKTSIIPHTIENLKNNPEKNKNLPEFIEQFKSFIGYTNEILNYWKPDIVCIERFQGRGIKGSLGETINYMISCWVFCSVSIGTETYIVTPAEWKNKFEKNYVLSLKNFYSNAEANGIPNHCVDSFLIGNYSLSLALNNKPFYFLSNKTLETIINEMVKNYE